MAGPMTLAQLDPSPMVHYTGVTPPPMSGAAFLAYVAAALCFLAVMLLGAWLDKWWCGK